MGKLILLAGLMFGLTSMLLETIAFVPRGTAQLTPVETQFQTSGVDREYVHGEHCIDGRTF